MSTELDRIQEHARYTERVIQSACEDCERATGHAVTVDRYEGKTTVTLSLKLRTPDDGTTKEG